MGIGYVRLLVGTELLSLGVGILWKIGIGRGIGMGMSMGMSRRGIELVSLGVGILWI